MNPLSEVLSVWHLFLLCLQLFFILLNITAFVSIVCLFLESWRLGLKFKIRRTELQSTKKKDFLLCKRTYLFCPPSPPSAVLLVGDRFWEMNEKANDFTLLPVASPMQGVKGAVCDSRTLPFLWTVNIPGFI